MRKSWPRPKVGDRFGEWTVLETGLRLAYKWRTVAACRLRCACGTEAVIWNANVVMGRSTSCRKCGSARGYNVSDEARKRGLDPRTALARVRRGWTLAQAVGLEAPPQRPRGPGAPTRARSRPTGALRGAWLPLLASPRSSSASASSAACPSTRPPRPPRGAVVDPRSYLRGETE